MGSITAIMPSAKRTARSRKMPSPAIRWVIAVATTSTPGIKESNGVGKKSVPPVTVDPTTTIRFWMASAAISPDSSETALIVRMVRR